MLTTPAPIRMFSSGRISILFIPKIRAKIWERRHGRRTSGSWAAEPCGDGFPTIPRLNLIYYGTGNPGVWNPDMREGDNKWSITIWARDPDTGQARWAYQVVPHDSWDYDEIMENVLVDMEWGGQMRKLLLHPGRTGFMFVLDRETGEVLSADPYQPVNWASGYNLKTGVPNIDPNKRVHSGVSHAGDLPFLHGRQRLHSFRLFASHGVSLHPGP